MLKFYYSGAPNPTKIALFLEEAGLPYEPIAVESDGGRFVAFRRCFAADAVLVAVPTRPASVGPREMLRGLPTGRWRNVMSDRAFEIGSEGLTLDRSWPFVIAAGETTGG